MNGILESREARWALIWIALVTGFRLWFAPRLDLVGDEAHYWECGRFLDWSHYGKGPGAAFVIRFFTLLLGDAVWVVRLPAVLLAAGTGWLIFLLGKTFYSDRVGLVAVVAASVMPLFAVGSILMTIDPLSVFFWAAAALMFWKAAEQPEKKRFWILTGLAVGLGFQAKYTNAAELVSFLIFLLVVPEKRRLIVSRGTFLMLGTVFLLMLPIILWNAFREWIGALHVFEGGDFNRGFRPDFGKFSGFWLLQAIVVSPLMFLVMLDCGVPADVFGDADRGDSPGGCAGRPWASLPPVAFLASFSGLRLGQPQQDRQWQLDGPGLGVRSGVGGWMGGGPVGYGEKSLEASAGTGPAHRVSPDRPPA
ncbi:MAG: phospholipid carrier-dependent glycosyltransferase [Verrucomicrobia bacterium]|nr:phospholipid carrier-dependent glycosyltransferase [Verrucomicrobiota bacterium]